MNFFKKIPLWVKYLLSTMILYSSILMFIISREVEPNYLILSFRTLIFTLIIGSVMNNIIWLIKRFR
jgi:hypothetical protein